MIDFAEAPACGAAQTLENALSYRIDVKQCGVEPSTPPLSCIGAASRRFCKVEPRGSNPSSPPWESRSLYSGLSYCDRDTGLFMLIRRFPGNSSRRSSLRSPRRPACCTPQRRFPGEVSLPSVQLLARMGGRAAPSIHPSSRNEGKEILHAKIWEVLAPRCL